MDYYLRDRTKQTESWIFHTGYYIKYEHTKVFNIEDHGFELSHDKNACYLKTHI